MRKVSGVILILLGAIILIGGPVGFYFLAALGCGMNTTGCQHFDFPWGEAVQILTIPMVFGALLVWMGLRLRKKAD